MSLIAGRPQKNLGCSFVLAWRRIAPKPRVSGPAEVSPACARFASMFPCVDAPSHKQPTVDVTGAVRGPRAQSPATARVVGQRALNLK